MYIYGDIVSEKWFDEEVSPQSVLDVLNTMGSMQVDDIDVYINSPGGSVFAGMAIYSALKRHPAAINVQVDGLAASIASVIAMAGDLVSISDVGMFMVHDPWSMVMGNSTELREQADVLDKVRDSMMAAYTRTGMKESDIMDLLAAETWMTAGEAVSLGFADEIVHGHEVAAKVPEGRFQHTPSTLILPKATVIKPPEPVADPKAVTKEDPPMPDNIDDQLTEAREQAVLQARADERQRVTHIKALFAKFPQHAETRSTCIEDPDCTTEMANAKLLEILAEDQGPLGGATRIQNVQDEKDAVRAGLVDGILQRCQAKDRDDSNPYRGFTMRDVARTCMAQKGMSVDKMSTEQVVRAAMTSESDFPILYEEAFHKVLLKSFRVIPDTWSQFMASGTLSDFRPHNRYRMGTFGNLPGLQENGEIKHTSLEDATKEQIQAEERGMIFTLSYKMVIDDDMQGLTNVATQFGRSARRTVETLAYEELLANPAMQDGTALFHADHGNLAASGTAISIASLGAARAEMRRQMDPSSNEYIDLLPAILLCPVELGDLARQVINSETDITKTNSKARNPIQNMVQVIDTPRLTGTGWYLFSSPSDTAIGEVGFLNGNTEPDTRMEEYFDSRGWKYRVTYDFGMAMLEHRAGYFNPGA